jgi:sigma-B regulation protein RsbU (phosphoserine phosphatase)
MERVNRTLQRRGVEGLFCTLSYARFDFEQGQLQLSNSGMPYPLLYEAKTGQCAPLQVAGLPLGAFPGSSYDELSVAVAPGDVLVFHSDGVTEAYNGRENYGMARLIEQVREKAQAPAPRLGEALLSDLHDFMAGTVPEDDVTLLVVKLR